MPALQIKDCPTDVYERLRACAREENRSIAQQALTCVEDYLDLRDGLKTSAELRVRATKALHVSEPFVPSSYRRVDDADYLTPRLEVFKRIDELEGFPASAAAPSAVEVLAQIRRQEAR